jgi:hypothetical protein
MCNKNRLSDEMRKALDENGYQEFGDNYKKQLPDGKTILAIRDGSGVILHFADEKGKILTQIKQPTIHPTMYVDDPNDLPSAEQDLVP